MPVKELEPNKGIDEFRAFTGEEGGPIRIVGAGLDVSEICNLACPHCYRENAKGQGGILIPGSAFNNMEKLKSNGATEIYFLGAEPTTNPYLPEMIQKAVDLDFKFILLVTHGLRLADEKYARQVLLPGVSLLVHRHTIDSDAVAQKIQEANVGKRGTLERSHTAWRNAEMIFKENGGSGRLMMQCCLTKSVMTNGNVDKVFRWAREKLGTLPIMEYVAPPHTGEQAQIEWLRGYPPLTGQIVAQLERFARIDKELGFPSLGDNNAFSPQAYNTTCTMTREGGQITNSGIYLPCTNMGPRSTHPLQFGNILVEPFEAIENHPVRRVFIQPNFRVKGCNDPCQGSGCWWTGLVTTGCYRLCQLNCVLNDDKLTIDDMPDLCNDCQLNQLRQEGLLNCGPGTRPGLALGETEKTLFEFKKC